MATAQGQEETQFSVANSMDPDAFAAGSPDKFIGIVKAVHAYPYVGKDKTKYYGYVGVRIVPDPESGFEEFTQPYFAFNFTGNSQGWPSKDGKIPCGGTVAEYAALGNGNGNLDAGPCLDDHKHVIPDHPNVGTYVLGRFAKFMGWQQFCDALRDCDTKGQIDRSPGPLTSIVGLKCRFDRVPQPKREGAITKAADDKDKQEFKTLVPTELISVGNKVTASVGSSSAQASSSAGTNGAGNIDDLIVAEILTQLDKAGDAGMTVGNLINSVPKAMIVSGAIDKKQKGYVMGWIGERDKASNLPTNLVDIDDTTYVPSTDTLSKD
jgi:hypothetical protein